MPPKSRRISRAVVRLWMSAFASFSNWRVQNQPCAAASSRAFATMPVPFSDGRRQHHPRAEEAHQPPALDGEAFGHHDDQGIALAGADHRKADAGVAAGRLDDCLAGLQQPVALGGLDHAQRQSVLDRAERIERLELGVDFDAFRREALEPHDRRVADGVEVYELTNSGHHRILSRGTFSKSAFGQSRFVEMIVEG